MNYSIERLDHLGIVAGVIKDLKIAELIDGRLGTYEGETLSAGETVAGMIINGLGFSNKPMTLAPLFLRIARCRYCLARRTLRPAILTASNWGVSWIVAIATALSYCSVKFPCTFAARNRLTPVSTAWTPPASPCQATTWPSPMRKPWRLSWAIPKTIGLT